MICQVLSWLTERVLVQPRKRSMNQSHASRRQDGPQRKKRTPFAKGLAMFKLLLATRYLRTRYIALASIVSVTLGVATMIVVNSVMSGFREEMYNRLHGILSDIVVASHGLDGIADTEKTVAQIRQVLGDDIAGLTTTVHVPAVLSYQVYDQTETRQVSLIGIDDETYASVGDFSQYLLHPENREQLSFGLRESGYDARIEEAGWGWRRWRVTSRRRLREHQELERARREQAATPPISQVSHETEFAPDLVAAHDPARQEETCPHCGESLSETLAAGNHAGDSGIPDAFQGMADPSLDYQDTHVFDEMTQQHPGLVLGISIANMKVRDEQGDIQDYFLLRPGDDVNLTFPSTGSVDDGRPPTAVHHPFTVVDFYESKMSEYDSNFAFCPLSKLQELRSMIDPETGKAAVTSIQLKLKAGVDLAAARDQLKQAFPVAQYRYRIETWKDMQGPLLAAVQWETTILNILLFLIIGVAGFGIFATFFMIVVEKTKDIGILKSLGAPSRGVMSIFVSYGFALGVVGSGVGMVLGVLFVTNINHIARWIEWLTGQEVFDPTVYYFHEIPTILNPLTIAWIVTGAMIIALMASIMPALRAARMHPVEALRYE